MGNVRSRLHHKSPMPYQKACACRQGREDDPLQWRIDCLPVRLTASHLWKFEEARSRLQLLKYQEGAHRSSLSLYQRWLCPSCHDTSAQIATSLSFLSCLSKLENPQCTAMSDIFYYKLIFSYSSIVYSFSLAYFHYFIFVQPQDVSRIQFDAWTSVEGGSHLDMVLHKWIRSRRLYLWPGKHENGWPVSLRNMEEAMKKLCQGGHLLPELGSLGWSCGMWCHCSTCHKHLLCTEFFGDPKLSIQTRTPLKDQLAEVSASLSTKRCGRLQWRSGPCDDILSNCPRVWQLQDSLWWIRMIKKCWDPASHTKEVPNMQVSKCEFHLQHS